MTAPGHATGQRRPRTAHHAEVILLKPEFDRPVGLRALHQDEPAS
jgi:hypothetical protein